MVSLYDMMIQHIEDNKSKYNIDYEESIKYLQELVDTIKKEYEKIELI